MNVEIGFDSLVWKIILFMVFQMLHSIVTNLSIFTEEIQASTLESDWNVLSFGLAP